MGPGFSYQSRFRYCVLDAWRDNTPRGHERDRFTMSRTHHQTHERSIMQPSSNDLWIIMLHNCSSHYGFAYAMTSKTLSKTLWCSRLVDTCTLLLSERTTLASKQNADTLNVSYCTLNGHKIVYHVATARWNSTLERPWQMVTSKNAPGGSAVSFAYECNRC